MSILTLKSYGGGPYAHIRKTRVGYSCFDADKDEIANDIKGRLKKYMDGHMNDPSHPMGRSFWPGLDGTGVPASESPLAHRELFLSRTGDINGCINEEGMKDILYTIGMELEICGQSVAAGVIKAMDKGGTNCTTWPEYLNSMFAVGPVSDSGAPDPTETQAQASAASTETLPPGVIKLPFGWGYRFPDGTIRKNLPIEKQSFIPGSDLSALSYQVATVPKGSVATAPEKQSNTLLYVALAGIPVLGYFLWRTLRPSYVMV